MNIREMKEWLNQFPDDTEVTLKIMSIAVRFNPDNHATFFDSTNNPYLKPDDDYYNRKVLEIGK